MKRNGNLESTVQNCSWNLWPCCWLNDGIRSTPLYLPNSLTYAASDGWACTHAVHKSSLNPEPRQVCGVSPSAYLSLGTYIFALQPVPVFRNCSNVCPGLLPSSGLKRLLGMTVIFPAVLFRKSAEYLQCKEMILIKKEGITQWPYTLSAIFTSASTKIDRLETD